MPLTQRRDLSKIPRIPVRHHEPNRTAHPYLSQPSDYEIVFV
jgi:hypothetical protein